MTSLPPPQRGIVPGFIPRKRYPMVATRQTIARDLIAAGMDKKMARAIGSAFGAIFEKQATDEFLNYRSIESIFPISSRVYASVVVGLASSGYGPDEVDFLATGTDDQVVINQAIEAADGGDVLLLEGTYSITGSILATHLQGADRLHLHGVGAGTVLDATGFNGVVIDAVAGESGPDRQWFTDFCIVGGDIGIEWASIFGLIRSVTFQGQATSAITWNTASQPPIITHCNFFGSPLLWFSVSNVLFAHNVLVAVVASLGCSNSFISANLCRDGTTIDITGNDNFVTLNDILGATLTDSGSGNILFANRTIAGLTGMFQTYTHTQAAPLTTWTVTHNLNCFPSVTVTTGGGVVDIADVEYVDANELLIHFGSAQSGLAYLN